MTKPTTSAESASIEKKLASYRSRSAPMRSRRWSGYAAATGAALAGSHAAEAAVVHVAPADPPVADAGRGSEGFSRRSIDIDSDGQDDLHLLVAFDEFASPDDSPGTAFASVGWTSSVNIAMVRHRLQPGDVISEHDSSCCYTMARGYPLYGSFFDPQFEAGTIGFALLKDEGPLFGWIRVELEYQSSGGLPEKATAFEWAYQTIPGRPILAGDRVPEPTGLMLLATGAAGVAALRRRAA